MEEMKRRTWSITMLALFLAVFVSHKTVLAVPGQLNYDVPATPGQPPIITGAAPDNRALDECNQRFTQTQEALKNCQKASTLTIKTDVEDDTEEHMYLTWAVISTIIAAVFGVSLVITLFRKKKKQPPPAPVIPPFTS